MFDFKEFVVQFYLIAVKATKAPIAGRTFGNVNFQILLRNA